MVMKVFYLKPDSSYSLEPSVCAIGYFDGVHLGHQQLLKRVEKIAQAKNMKKALMTFSCHPKEILGKKDFKYLMSLQSKIAILEKRGFDYFFIIEFNQDVSQYSPTSFLECYLYKNNIEHLVCGFDFHFGKNGQGDTRFLKNIQKENFSVDIIEEYDVDGVKVSSSFIRNKLEEGQLEQANQLLSRPYRISGKVIYGLQNGRKIGFPTANVDAGHYVILKKGVYGVYFYHDGKCYLGMANVGLNPTVGEITKISLEVNVFDFDEDIYGEEVDVDFMFRVRDERKFASLDDLKQQLKRDERFIRHYFD